MSDSSRTWLPQDILWELGASFVNATADTAASAIETAMQRVSLLLGCTAAGVWEVDPATMDSTRIHHWAVDETFDLGDGAPLSPDPAVNDAVREGGGIAIVDVELLLGSEMCEAQGWVGGSAVVAVIDTLPQSTVALVLASAEREWGDDAVELIRGTVLLLRQFSRRVWAEQQLQHRQRTSDLVVSLAARFQTTTFEAVDAEVERAFVEMREMLGAEAVVLVDLVDEQTIELAHVITRVDLPADWRTLTVPDLSAVPGAEGLTLREFVARPRLLELAGLVDAVLGADVTDAMGLRTPLRRVALLPASVADGDSLLAATRLDNEWLPQELDALSTLASLVAQTRGRVAAERSSQGRLDAQQALAATGKRFLEADADTAPAAIHDTLALMAGHLEADLAIIASIGADHETVTIVDSWSRTGALSVAAGTTMNRNAFDVIDRAMTEEVEVLEHAARADLDPSLRDSPDGKWTTVVAPIRGAGLPSAAVTFVWTHGLGADAGRAGDLANATADLIAQLNVRLRAEETVKARLATERVMSALSDEFMGASHSNAESVTARAIERFGSALGFTGVALRRVTDDGPVAEAVWAAPGQVRPSLGHVFEMPRRIRREDVARFMEERHDAAWMRLAGSQWGPGVVVTAQPVLVGGEIDSLLNVAARSALADHEADAVRAFAAMLGQFRARVAEEHVGLRRLMAQRLLSACASGLAEATTENFNDVVEQTLAAAAAFCGVDAIIDWQVDRRNERYVRARGWVDPDHTDSPRIDTVPWGAGEILDAARAEDRVVTRGSDRPTEADPTRVAIPRGEGGSVDFILQARSRRPGPWRDEVLELLESLSRMIHEVDARVAAQRYAEAAFHGAPIGVILRDSDLNLITCNQAFVDFLGADSVEELVGSAPEAILDQTADPVDWVQGAEGQMVGVAAYRGPGGSRVWGQMRASMVGDTSGDHFWLVHNEDVTERRRSEQLLRFQASHDELTGLANRRRLLEEVHRIADGPGSVAVLLLDLDRFKNVNDSLGHDRGDELLVVIADRLRLAVRPGDLVARLGGDEFAIVLPGPVAVAEAEFVAERLLRLIGEPVTVGRQKIYPTASIGISVADEHTAVEDLLRRADTAMYRAKAQGRARSESFDEELRDAVTARMATESGLRGALRGDELLVHYQPEVSLDDGRVLGAEALIRWQHPEKGLLPAGAFIEVAEETGLVVEMGEMVLAEACREAASWPGGDDGPMIRVNLAAAQLQRDDTVSLVSSVLESTGLLPSRLCLEITESAVMSDVTRAEEILLLLKNLGVQLAVDDFGTGFSSLAYLKRFPVDALKIDRAFVKDLGSDAEDEAFVRSIVSLAGALGLEVVAEGVETEAQAAKLVELGCHRAQGFFFGRPAAPEAIRAMLSGDRV